MMNKRTVYTIMGVALSVAIALGGWTLTGALIERKSNALLSETGITQIYLPPEGADEPDGRPRLDEAEIVAVLRSWETPGPPIVHEPIAGQVTMEQAIAEARAGLALLAGQGLNIGALLDDSARVVAYLSHNVQEGQRGQPIDPNYSYWTVTFAEGELRATAIINAATGQAWNLLVASPLLAMELDVGRVDGILSAYMSHLELTGGEKNEVALGRDNLRGLVRAGSLYAYFEGVGKPTQGKTINVAEFALGLHYTVPFGSDGDITVQTYEELTT